jgi:hypothetical protein
MTLQGWNLLKEVDFTKDRFLYLVDLAQEPRDGNRSRCTGPPHRFVFPTDSGKTSDALLQLWRHSSRTPTKSSPIRRAGEPMRGNGNLWIGRHNDPHHYPGSSSRDP